jgi:hypothetical protein
MERERVGVEAQIGRAGATDSAGEIKRWSVSRKKKVLLRLLRGEPMGALS